MTSVSAGDTAVPALASVDGRRLGQAETHDSLAARNSRLTPGELLTVKVRRSEVPAGGEKQSMVSIQFFKHFALRSFIRWNKS